MAQRTAPPLKRNSTMRPPPRRPHVSRAQSATPTLNGRASPADSDSSRTSRTQSPQHGGGMKRKERDFDQDVGEETNINVVVRCRGRSDRELKENSGVVVSADGVKGSAVELSMGPSALSNKRYQFDRVFSPAADQGMVFDEVVQPILNEVVSGFNCTIFAYGQTGTGKTYTMSGDITDMLPLPDEAGIVPRVLHSLFSKLENENTESSVKCSFIELYNEELRDLVATDDTVKLKIFEDASRKSHSATLVQGIEETFIDSASKGIKLLSLGSYKRQVAATKCNDLSSRSHTVFTITTYIKRKNEAGEDYVCSGKLNLVDLAGSENIQRSGAENKRATEAGLINKSLLTLGRVINALVDKNSHIPYRESKLTRLLQDSLGGRTKTCIIATLSPAKSNLEESISTLDYAFRAKNIRNKPQVNQMVSKKTLIREFTGEIEKLKSELIVTRQRNGVYLTSESYEELTTESESRRILSEEQKDRIETMEANLRNKAQELFALTNLMTTLKKDSEGIKNVLHDTQDTLGKTEVVLGHTRQTLAEEEMLRRAHQHTETKLSHIGQDLISTLGKTTSDISGLHAKNKRKSELQSLNRAHWSSSQNQVSDTTQLVEQRLCDFESNHQEMIANLSERMQGFVREELSKLEESKAFVDGKTSAFEKSEAEVNGQTSRARDEMNEVLEGIQSLRDDVKKKVGQGLDGLSGAAQQISAGIIHELEGFHAKLHLSYSSLGKDFKNTFDDLTKRLQDQELEVQNLRKQLSAAGDALTESNQAAGAKLDSVLAEERTKGAEDRASLMSQISNLVQSFGETQENRLDSKVKTLQGDISKSNETYESEQRRYGDSMDAWAKTEQSIQDGLKQSREAVKTHIQQDWTTANQRTTSIQQTTRSVHEETVRIVDAQMKNMDEQLQSLDAIVTRVREQNNSHHTAHVESLHTLGTNVKQSYESIGEHLTQSSNRTRGFAEDLQSHTKVLDDSVEPLQENVKKPLEDLRADILAAPLAEYVSTGQTPSKTTKYDYERRMPRTDAHDKLLATFRGSGTAGTEEDIPEEVDDDTARGELTEALPAQEHTGAIHQSPTKGKIYTDFTPTTTSSAHAASLPTSPVISKSNAPAAAGGLREIDINAVSPNKTVPIPVNPSSHNPKQARAAGEGFSASVGIGGKGTRKPPMAAGRENVPPSSSVGAGGGSGGGRSLRNRTGGGS
ncbi:MAG: kinesin motor protein cin8 [Alyxoria varia]|nr:MAG: kinesin motor protein cin8 [Alyxoria varia]